MVIALGVFLLSFVRKSADLQRVGLEILFIIALLTIPVYLSGVSAQQNIQSEPGVSRAMIDRHQDMALLGLVLMQVAGLVAWLALWQTRRVGRAGGATLATVLILSVLTVATMGRAANLAGPIRHPEILQGNAEAFAASAAAAGEAATFSAAALGAWVVGQTWVWPASEALHFVGLWLLFGVVLFANLRVLGVMKEASFASVHRLLPWAVLGLAINVVTGMAFVTAAPDQYAGNLAFYWKIGMLMVAGINLLYLTAFDEPWTVGAGDSAPVGAKAVAASGIAMWVGVMYFGRMLPFIGHAF
jgi:hypothetical protein